MIQIRHWKFFGRFEKGDRKIFFALESKLELVLNQIADLKEEKVLSYSITDIDIQIRRESKYKGMGLDFLNLMMNNSNQDFKVL